MTKVLFKKLHENAVIPKRATAWSAGFDLCATDPVYLHGDRVLVGTGIAAAIPPGHVGLIRSRSSLATKHGVEVAAGVIDADFRGEIKVCLISPGGPWSCKPGDRIAQLLIMPVVLDSEEVDDLDATERGTGGFGSTGV